MEQEKLTLTQRTRPSSPGLSGNRSKHEKRRLAWIGFSAFALFCILLLKSFSHSAKVNCARKSVRRQQTMVGFTQSLRDAMPADLRAKTSSRWSVDELINHPLYHKPVPTCVMTATQTDRYSVFSEIYRPRERKRRHGALLPRDKPHMNERYFIAIDLYSSSEVVPALARALYALVYSLGSDRFFVSIYENGSTDETPQQLLLLARILDKLNVGYHIQSSGRLGGWKNNERIAGLAAARNTVMEPLFAAPPRTWDRVLFINDIVLCGSDILELLLQHEAQEADMSCGMDYKELRIPEFDQSGYPVLFYDVWVAREMLGLPFYKIKYPSGDWLLPTPPLVHSPARPRAESLLPFQVFSCFNGISVINARFFEPPYSLRFRTLNGTDEQSECYLFCSDIWKVLEQPPARGIAPRGARLQVVPRTSVAYTLWDYNKIRKDWNVTAFEKEKIYKGMPDPEMIEWQRYPPKRIASYPFARWSEESWEPPF